MSIRDLEGGRVVVVGGSSGIGFAVAQGALAAGARVLIGSRDGARVEAARERLGDGADGAVVDVRDEASVARFFETVGTFDHLVFSAGDWDTIRASNPLPELDLDVAAGVFGVRFWGALLAVKHALGRIDPQGSITLTNGMVAHRPRKGAALNTAMAGAIEHLVRALAVDLAPLRVNAVCPGLVLTEVWHGVSEEQKAARIEAMTGRQPLPRAADPEEIAQAYLYAMRGTYSTGQVLMVDGGMSLV